MDLSSILGGISGAANGLGNALYPADPNMAPYVDPAVAAQARNQGLIHLGLGIMSAPYSMTGLGSGLAAAYDGAEQNYQGAMDKAFRNTVARKTLQNQQEDRDFLQREREIQGQQADLSLKTAQRADRQQAAVVAQRVMKGLSSAQDPQAYLGLVQNDPDVKDAFSTLGIQPPYVGPMAAPGNLDQFKQQLATAASAAPPPAPIKLSQGDVLVSGTDPSGPPLASAAPKQTVEWKDDGTQLIPVSNVTGQRIPGLAPIPKPQNTFTPDQSALLGALAERGISLPAGMRSKAQQVQTLDGLLKRNAGKSPDEIADLVGTGQINFGADKKESQIAAAQAGKVATAENEIINQAPLLRQASAAVPRGNFMPISRLMQAGEGSISDPNLKKLKIYVTSMLNAYDQLAARGGTDMNKRAEAHALLTSADGPEAFNAGIDAFLREAQIAKLSAEQAAHRKSPSVTGATADTQAGAASGAPTGANGQPLW